MSLLPTWTRDEAIALCKMIEAIAPSYGAHVALTGGLLYKDGPRKDCDVLLYRIRQRSSPIDFAGLFTALESVGITLVHDFGWCKKMRFHGKSIDLFDPEASGQYPVNVVNLQAGVVEVPLDNKELRVLDEICQKQDMSRIAVLRQALRVYQLVKETPRAMDAVQALRPQLGPVGCMGDDD